MAAGQDGTTVGADEITRLADEMLDILFTADPLGASLMGIPGYEGRMPDPSAAAEQAQRERALDVAVRAEALLERVGPGTDAVTAAVVAQQARAFVTRLDAATMEYTITPTWEGPVGMLLTYFPMMVTPDAPRAEEYLTRLRGIPEYLEAALERHGAGLAAGRAPVAPLVRAAIEHIDRYLGDPANDPFARAQDMPEYEAFAAARERVLAEVVRPAIARYRDALVDRFEAAGRPEHQPGLCWLPGGDAIYAGLARVHTTTERTPEELHETGLAIIERLAGEYAELGARVFGTGDLAEIFERLRTDQALRWRDGEELLDAARAAVTRAEREAPRWFNRMPSTNCLVEPVPEANGPSAAAAYYMPPALDGSRRGTYFANTYHAQERSRHLAEATAYHEAVPGHHFQLTIALELTDLPLLRRVADANAYAEGWGLYCERLADEMGLYSDDVARLGMLTLDSMRASRLVVDTGLHAKGWSRQQAIDYMVTNTPMVPLEIVPEVDRYISTPGQALSYMVGRLEFERLRADATARLGERFDIREFHDEVLGCGPLPMGVLAQVIDGWVRARA